MSARPFSPASERNREPILGVLGPHFADRRSALEIGSGTGQHAVHFAAALPGLTWQTSERAENLAGLRAWLDEAALSNTPAPLDLDVARGPWPARRFDAVFTANTLHIMAWSEVQALFAALPSVTGADAKLIVYGPFNVAGLATSASNAAFDASLRERAPHMGVRSVEAVSALAAQAGFTFLEDRLMPANNRCLVWQRGGA